MCPDRTRRGCHAFIPPDGRCSPSVGGDSDKLTAPSCQVDCLTCGPELGSHPYQVSEGIRLHLLHDLPSMCLYCDLANAELATNLFVQQPGNYQRHKLPFARGERRVTVPEFLYLRFVAENCAAAFKGLSDGAQQYLVIKRFR